MQEKNYYSAGLYLRLSKDDEQDGESVSIGTQRSILLDYCSNNQYPVYKIYVDDGYSGLNFARPGFQELLEDIELGAVNMVITKDLSRLGRDYIMTGYYSEIYFPAKSVRYIAIGDGFDSLKGYNDIAPFKNILNDMYARDISKKICAAKRQQAKQGLFIGSQPPFGYRKDPSNKNHLVIDPEAAEVVRTIFALAACGWGSVAIAEELEHRKIESPSVYKYNHGDTRFEKYPALKENKPYQWCYGTIGQILRNPVYTGCLISLKTQTTNCKTKQRAPVPAEQQIVTANAHEAIITQAQFDAAQAARESHKCPAKASRYNLFRGKLFCESCGRVLSITQKQLLDQQAEIYFCAYHFRRPDVCAKTHQIYHDMLYSYVLQQIRAFARSMKRRKVNVPIKDYGAIQVLTPEILNDTIERIEISHVTKKSRPSNVIHIYWKLK